MEWSGYELTWYFSASFGCLEYLCSWRRSYPGYLRPEARAHAEAHLQADAPLLQLAWNGEIVHLQFFFWLWRFTTFMIWFYFASWSGSSSCPLPVCSQAGSAGRRCPPQGSGDVLCFFCYSSIWLYNFSTLCRCQVPQGRWTTCCISCRPLVYP